MSNYYPNILGMSLPSVFNPHIVLPTKLERSNEALQLRKATMQEKEKAFDALLNSYEKFQVEVNKIQATKLGTLSDRKVYVRIVYLQQGHKYFLNELMSIFSDADENDPNDKALAVLYRAYQKYDENPENFLYRARVLNHSINDYVFSSDPEVDKSVKQTVEMIYSEAVSLYLYTVIINMKGIKDKRKKIPVDQVNDLYKCSQELQKLSSFPKQDAKVEDNVGANNIVQEWVNRIFRRELLQLTKVLKRS